ncbi:MAG: DUF3617 family protein [Sphingomonas sp.]|nr:DUF3617 family protein [Sphingomonas sp.]
MRAIACMFPLLFATACGGGEAEVNEAAPVATTIVAGQWELASEVTDFRSVDQGQPTIDTPVGTRSTGAACVGADTRPPTAFFAGEGYACEYGAYYVRNGRINVTLACTREGLSGSIPISAEGRITADGVEFTRTIRTVLVGDGDVEISANVTGRRTGDCAPEANDSEDNAAAPAG